MVVVVNLTAVDAEDYEGGDELEGSEGGEEDVEGCAADFVLGFLGRWGWFVVVRSVGWVRWPHGRQYFLLIVVLQRPVGEMNARWSL